MLRASYNTPPSKWTGAIDDALGELSQSIWGDANFEVEVGSSPTLGGPLAAAGKYQTVDAGTLADGQMVKIPGAAARFQGWDDPHGFDSDFRIRVSEEWPWSFDGAEPGKYHAPSVMMHEVMHGLGVFGGRDSYKTPFDLWAAGKGIELTDPSHLHDDNSLMRLHGETGKDWSLSPLDLEALGQIGIPTRNDDLFYLINGAKLDGGPGNDTAIWLNPFDQYNANLTGIERLQLGGKDPLTAGQQDIYKLYSAGLGRDPDLAGFQYWNASGKGLLDMATDFFHAPEFAQTAQAPTNRDYISSLYQNILGREPEQAGLDYWDRRTDLDRSGLLANIAVAPENKIDIPTFLL